MYYILYYIGYVLLVFLCQYITLFCPTCRSGDLIRCVGLSCFVGNPIRGLSCCRGKGKRPYPHQQSLAVIYLLNIAEWL